MEPFVRLTGATAPLDRANVDTDQIIPKQFLKRIERTGFGEFLFFDWRNNDPDFVLARPEFRHAPILVAGANFGSGSSREHAPWALQDWGYRAIIAPSYADIFRSNCAKVGLLCVVLPEADVAELLAAAPAEVTVDLERQTVTLPSGREVVVRDRPDARGENLLNGWDDIALTFNREAEIAAYERHARAQGARHPRPRRLSAGREHDQPRQHQAAADDRADGELFVLALGAQAPRARMSGPLRSRVPS